MWGAPIRVSRKFWSKLAKVDPIKRAYLRTSFIFAVSILVTWTPSSINRVYSLVHPTKTSYSLNVAGAVVLPLQGLWNAVIFVFTTWAILKDEFREIARGQWFGRRLSDDRANQPPTPGRPGFRTRHSSVPENRELPTIPPRMANVRVIRGGSL